MIKRSVLVTLLLLSLLALYATPVFAADCASLVFFDTANGDNNANGTSTAPVADYATAFGIGRASGQSGCIYEVLDTGDLAYRGFYNALAPNTGIPLPTSVLYGLLAFLAAGLLVAGWWMQRRATNLRVTTAT